MNGFKEVDKNMGAGEEAPYKEYSPEKQFELISKNGYP